MVDDWKKEWLPLLVTFNHDLLAYLHRSWWDEVPHGELAGGLQDGIRARTHLNRYLAKCLQVSPQPALAFEERLWRVALLPADALWSLCLSVGVCRHARAIRGIIDGEARRRLEAAIGPARVSLALRQSLEGSGLAPEWEIGEPPGNADELAAAGMELIIAQTEPLPCEIGSRLRLKCPAAWQTHPWWRASRKSPGGEAWLLRNITGRLPRWQPLFA